MIILSLGLLKEEQVHGPEKRRETARSRRSFTAGSDCSEEKDLRRTP